MDRRIGTAFDRLRILERRMGRPRRIAQIPLTRLRDRSDPMECFDAIQFKARFHIFKDTALYIVDLIKGDLCASLRRGTHIPPHIQFLIVQRFFCDGSFQLTTSDNYKVSQPTVSNLVKRVATAIAKLRKRFIKYPTFAEAPVVRTAIYNIANDANSGTRGFPGVVGAIDGTHIPIVSPGGEDAGLFRNRKRVFSVNVQAVCDHQMIFTNLVARWYGSAHDSRIFENSKLCQDLENGTAPGILLGDAGYGCKPYLMPPLLRPTTVPEKRYNRAQIKTRNLIERAFGVWKRKFPCLKFMRLKMKTVLIVIVATAVMHNISRYDIWSNFAHYTI
ncbi:putative nuclease HARBI1 [Folsomia candida]|uniref:putative nuclease HARBI1 n=1 Tax=Folsomia candida TaxID=158441 RepID=UPI0016055E68|nr:putative nuclease HARBI1 [Folsomia candida]